MQDIRENNRWNWLWIVGLMLVVGLLHGFEILGDVVTVLTTTWLMFMGFWVVLKVLDSKKEE